MLAVVFALTVITGSAEQEIAELNESLLAEQAKVTAAEVSLPLIVNAFSGVLPHQVRCAFDRDVGLQQSKAAHQESKCQSLVTEVTALKQALDALKLQNQGLNEQVQVFSSNAELYCFETCRFDFGTGIVSLEGLGR